MNESNSVNVVLEKIAQILIRCFVMGLFVLCFWLISVLSAGNLAHKVQSAIIPISIEHFHLINYAGMLAIKAFLLVFFLLPYIAIRLVLRKHSAA
ncbi:MAG: DUF6868 family protein [Pseudomonadota bacterium]